MGSEVRDWENCLLIRSTAAVVQKLIAPEDSCKGTVRKCAALSREQRPQVTATELASFCVETLPLVLRKAIPTRKQDKIMVLS